MERTKLIKVLLVILVLFLLFEIGVRIYWEKPVRTYSEGMLIKDDFSGFALNPGFEGYILDAEGYDLTTPVRINSKGLRDDETEYETDEPRVVVLGDTITFGMRVPYEETYSSLLEERLDTVDVVNLGVPAYEPMQAYLRYYSEGYKYKPDLVVVTFAMNDVLYADIDGYKAQFDTYGDFYTPDAPVEAFVKKICRSCTFLYSVYYNRHYGFSNRGYLAYAHAQWKNDTAFGEFSDNLRDFHTVLKQQNIPLVVVMYPYVIQMEHDAQYDSVPQERMRALCEQEGIPFIDILPLVDTPDYERYFTSDGRIASSHGHEKIAEALASYLEEHEFLLA